MEHVFAALFAFIGALGGALAVQLFARRTAINQALGHEYAVRRVSLIEDLASAIADVELHINGKGKRALDDLQRDFASCWDREHLYLSVAVEDALYPVCFWLEDSIAGRKPRPIEHNDFRQMRTLLAEALKGTHQR